MWSISLNVVCCFWLSTRNTLFRVCSKYSHFSINFRIVKFNTEFATAMFTVFVDKVGIFIFAKYILLRFFLETFASTFGDIQHNYFAKFRRRLMSWPPFKIEHNIADSESSLNSKYMYLANIRFHQIVKMNFVTTLLLAEWEYLGWFFLCISAEARAPYISYCR